MKHLYHLIILTITPILGIAQVQVPEMIFVEGGTYKMGCTSEQGDDCDIDEVPVREVTLNSFYASKYEVTQAEWESLMEVNPSNYINCGSNCPVEDVSRYDVMVYCNRLSEFEGLTPCYYGDEAFTKVFGKSGDTWTLPNAGDVYWFREANGYRIPTEAEWEYAARGGNQSKGYKFSGSNNIDSVAWWDINNDNSLGAQPVGQLAPNELGFHDMTGNLFEWCWDRYVTGYYRDASNCQPIGPDTGDDFILRGGSWGSSAKGSRVANRGDNVPTLRNGLVGLRLIRGAVDPEYCSCRNLDSLALVEFYNATNGPDWTNSWDLSQPIDSWYGVQLNSEECVTVLDLDGVEDFVRSVDNGNNVIGPLVDLNLPNLESLYLQNNQFSGAIPDFSKIPELKHLVLRSNQFNGTIPDFSGIPNLEYLGLGDNQLTGSIPDFSNLPNLQIFSASQNQLSGTIPNFTNLPALDDLSLFSNQLEGEIPDFSNLPKLRDLTLSLNQLTGTIPNFSNLPVLWRISLAANQLSGSIPDFSNIPNLSSIDFGINQLTGPIPDFSNLPNLQSLYLKNNELTGTIPNFSNLPILSALELPSNQLNGDLPDFANLNGLSRLILNNNQLTGCYPEKLRELCPEGFTDRPWVNGFNLTNNVGLPWEGDMEQWCNNQSQIGAPCDDGNTLTVNDVIGADCTCKGSYEPITPEMILIERGTFDMGCTAEQNANFCDEAERPVHPVQLTTFYLGKYEVTRAEWESLMETPARDFDECGLNCPAILLSWYDVVVYCNRLSVHEGYRPSYYSDENFTQVYGNQGGDWSLPNSGAVYWDNSADGYRLPTEAEWEFAARGGNESSGFRYAGSNEVDEVSWHTGNANGNSFEVGRKLANELGFFDMNGNAFEWCWDFYSETYYQISAPCSPTGPQNEDSRVRRGGSFGVSGSLYGVSIRSFFTPDLRNIDNGFRLARGSVLADECPVTPCSITDSLALIEFYNATDGPNWTNSWNFSDPMDTWFGITLNEERCLAEINLNNNQLKGTIPPIIENFTGLKVLSLNNNQLTSTLPTELMALDSLVFLDLSKNQLEGALPMELTQLVQLQHLDLSDNAFSGTIPDFSPLPSLITIGLDYNQLTGTMPNWTNLPGLTKLSVNNNQLEGALPKLEGMPNLIELHLQDNQFSGPLPEEWSALSQITMLYLNNNQLEDCFPASFDVFCNLNFNEDYDETYQNSSGAIRQIYTENGYNFTNNLGLKPEAGNFTLFCELGVAACCELTIQANLTSPTCFEGSDGSIELTQENGVGPFLYNWTKTDTPIDSGNGDGVVIPNLLAGSYSITLTDLSNNCEAVIDTVLIDGVEVEVSCRQEKQQTNENNSDGEGIVSISSGAAPFLIEWTGTVSDAKNDGIVGENSLPNLSAGNYEVKITDAKGCKTTCTFSIELEPKDPCKGVVVPTPQTELANVEFCNGTTIDVLTVEQQEGLTFNWYDQNGLILAKGTPQYQPNKAGDYYVESEQLSSGCKSENQKVIQVKRLTNPKIRIVESLCTGTNNESYFVSFIVQSVDSVASNYGVIETFGDVYTIFDIPIGRSIQLNAYNRYGCTVLVTVPIPACDCGEIDPPQMDTEELFYCPSSGVPTLEASVNQGLTVDWYDRREGGNPLATNTLRFSPSEQGRYYAETVDPATNCRSQVRTRTLLFPDREPFIQKIDVFCDTEGTFYTLLLEVTNQDNISASAGNLVNEGNGVYSVSNIPIKDSVLIRATNDFSGCSTQYKGGAPSCICDTLPAPIVPENIIEYCDNEIIPTISAGSPINTSINWYTEPQGGELVAQFRPTFRPESPGTYYAQTVSENGDCISQKRVGVQVRTVPVDTTVFWVETCRIDSLIDQSRTYKAQNGCDSVVFFRYFMGKAPETIYDTQFVCSPSLVDTIKRDTILEGCSSILVTYKWLDDLSEQAVVGEDIFSCDTLDNVQLFANAPKRTTGRWLPTENANIEDPNDFETLAILLGPDRFEFIYALSTEFCSDYSKDTMVVWSSGELEAINDNISIKNSDELQGYDLLGNDKATPNSILKPVLLSENTSVVFNQDGNGDFDGTINYDPNIRSGIIEFYYELCDSLCAISCDTAKVNILVDCLETGEIVFKNGFIPYQNEEFDPIASVENNESCDQKIDVESSSLLIFDEFGNKVRTYKPYDAWDGQSEQGFIMPVGYYYWMMDVVVTSNDFEKTITFTGAVLLYND